MASIPTPRTHDDSPAYKPGDRIIVSWDTALSAKDLASYSVGIVLHVRGDTVWVLDVVRERPEYLKPKVIELHQGLAPGRKKLCVAHREQGLGDVSDSRIAARQHSRLQWTRRARRPCA